MGFPWYNARCWAAVRCGTPTVYHHCATNELHTESSSASYHIDRQKWAKKFLRYATTLEGSKEHCNSFYTWAHFSGVMCCSSPSLHPHNERKQ